MESLTDRERGLIEGACLATLRSTLDSSAKLSSDAFADLAKAGVRIEAFPEGVLAAFRQAWTEIAKDEGDRDYFFRSVLDDIEKFRAKPATPEPAPAPTPAPNVSAEPNAAAETKAIP